MSRVIKINITSERLKQTFFQKSQELRSLKSNVRQKTAELGQRVEQFTHDYKKDFKAAKTALDLMGLKYTVGFECLVLGPRIKHPTRREYKASELLDYIYKGPAEMFRTTTFIKNWGFYQDAVDSYSYDGSYEGTDVTDHHMIRFDSSEGPLRNVKQKILEMSPQLEKAIRRDLRQNGGQPSATGIQLVRGLEALHRLEAGWFNDHEPFDWQKAGNYSVYTKDFQVGALYDLYTGLQSWIEDKKQIRSLDSKVRRKKLLVVQQVDFERAFEMA